MLNLTFKAGLVAAVLLTPVMSLAGPALDPKLEQSPAAFSDAQLLRLLDVAFKNDRDSAKAAIGTSHNIRVKGMADDMLRDCVGLAKKLQTISTEKGLQAEDSEASQTIAQQAAQDLRELQAAFGDEFDHVYLRQVIDAQFALIALLRQADSATQLAGLRDQALVQAGQHLLFAQQLRGDLGRLAN